MKKTFYKHPLLLTVLAAFLITHTPVTTALSDKLKTLKPPFTAPEIRVSDPAAWLNSQPMNMGDLRGKVVMIDFWTFGCINCKRSIPWLQSIEKKYAARDFELIGVHTPEFDYERKRDNVIEQSKKLGRHHPIVIDNDFSIWRSYKNRYWPAFYIIDKKGIVRGAFVGETHIDSGRAKAMERLIEKLIGEKPA